MIPDLIFIHLAYIINMSLLTGGYPDLLKVVKVIPIHKGGSTQEVNNYCPISLLSIFDKIIEKLMQNLTIYALAQITEMIKVSIDSGKFGCGIFIHLIL